MALRRVFLNRSIGWRDQRRDRGMLKNWPGHIAGRTLMAKIRHVFLHSDWNYRISLDLEMVLRAYADSAPMVSCGPWREEFDPFASETGRMSRCMRAQFAEARRIVFSYGAIQ